MENVPVSDKLQAKLARALSKIGLSWATYASIVDIRSKLEGIDVGTALWYYDPKTKKERVAIDPKMIEEYNVDEIGLIVKHELLHKAMYRNIVAKDRALVNFALDACINKILTLSAPKTMYGFCRDFYKQQRTGPSAICNCSLTEQEFDLLHKNLKAIWEDIYSERGDMPTGLQQNRCYNQEVPDPLTIYNKILLAFTRDQQQQIKKQYVYANDNGKSEETEETEQENNDEEEQDNDEDTEREEAGDNSESVEEEESDESDDGDSKEEDEEDDTGEDQEDSGEEELDDESESDSGPEEEESEEDLEESNEGTESKDSEGSDEDDNSNIEDDVEEDKIQVRGGSDGKRANDKQSVKDEVNSVRKVFEGGYCPYGVSQILEKMVYQPQEANTKDLQSFIGTWQTLRQVEGIEATIYAEIASHIKFDPYPDGLSRTGLEYVALGVSGPDAIPLYLNQNDKRDSRKKVCCYFDTSPSMNPALPYMVHIAKFFEALEETQLAGGESAGKYVFSGDVEGMTPAEWNDMCNGEMKTGWSTDFDKVIEHANSLISDEDVDIIVILTDGESSVNDENIQAFNNTTKRCYRIYFDCGHHGWGIKKTVNGIESSLDQLNGSSFTVKVGDAAKS